MDRIYGFLRRKGKRRGLYPGKKPDGGEGGVGCLRFDREDLVALLMSENLVEHSAQRPPI